MKIAVPDFSCSVNKYVNNPKTVRRVVSEENVGLFVNMLLRIEQ